MIRSGNLCEFFKDSDFMFPIKNPTVDASILGLGSNDTYKLIDIDEGYCDADGNSLWIPESTVCRQNYIV
jgi:hypothetical protein